MQHPRMQMNPQKKLKPELSAPIALFLILAFLFTPCGAVASVFMGNLRLLGDFYLRRPSGVRFSLLRSNDEEPLTKNSILTVRSSAEYPMATDSRILIGSHTLVCYPGTTLKILSDAITPILGRLEIISREASEPLRILTGKYSGEILDGNVILEVTPDSGTFVVMRDKGNAWFKDMYRRVFVLQPGSQLHFPLFGQTREETAGSFWTAPPSSFSTARTKLEPAKYTSSEADEKTSPDEVEINDSKEDKEDKEERQPKLEELETPE